MERRLRATVSTKGQVTIPGSLRKRLGIGAGTVIEFREEPGRLVVTKAPAGDPIEGLIGILHDPADPRTTDDLITQMRGPAGLP